MIPRCPACNGAVHRRLSVPEKLAMLAPVPWGLTGVYECDGCGRRYSARAGLEGAMLGAGFLLPALLLAGHVSGTTWLAWGGLLVLWVGVSLGYRSGKWGEQETLFTGAMIAFFWMAGIATSDAPWARELIERGNDERTLWMCMIGGFVYAYLARLAGLVTMGELREEEPRADRN